MVDLQLKTRDVIVDQKKHGADYYDIQQADDFADANAYSMWVNKGTYAGFTVSTNNVHIFCAPGVVITGAITLSGTGIKLFVGGQSDLQGLVTLSGANGGLVCGAGVDGVGISVSAADCFIDGGGHDTLMNGGTTRHGIAVNGTRCIVQHIAVQTTAGGASGYDGLQVLSYGTFATLRGIRVVDSDDAGIVLHTDGCVVGSVIENSDGHSIQVNGPRNRIIGNYGLSAGDDGIALLAQSNDSVVVGNTIKDTTGNAIEVNINGEDCCVVGNRVDGAVVDNSGTSTVADNDAEAF